MSLKKQEVAEWVLSKHYGGPPPDDAEMDIRDVYLAMQSAISYLIEKNYRMNERDTGAGFINGGFISSFTNNAIVEDTQRDEWYTALPATLPTLVRDYGLQEVRDMKNANRPFVISSSPQRSLMGEMASANLHGNIGIYIEGTRLYYHHRPLFLKRVLIKMVASVDDLSDTDFVPVPASMEVELLEMTLKMMITEKTADKVNDSSDASNSTR